jgi:[CysO sulfur-carrier protein]-S-L-cysteine hydrolase
LVDLDDVLFKEIVEQARREFPNECCGVVAADGDDRPVKVFAARNSDASSATYRIDPRDLMRIFDDIDAMGGSLWAFFHSHTHSKPVPSKTDLREAAQVHDWFPDTRYLIVSLMDRDRPEIRSFVMRDGDFSEEGIVIA